MMKLMMMMLMMMTMMMMIAHGSYVTLFEIFPSCIHKITGFLPQNTSDVVEDASVFRSLQNFHDMLCKMTKYVACLQSEINASANIALVLTFLPGGQTSTEISGFLGKGG